MGYKEEIGLDDLQADHTSNGVAHQLSHRRPLDLEGIDDLIENQLGNLNFETEQAEDRAREILEAKYKITPLQSLDGLVKAQILGAIPPAPDGKTWKYDVDTKTVSLE